MESEDIEDGEILEDESNSNEPTFQNNKEFATEYDSYEPKPTRFDIKNNFDNFFPHKEKRIHHHESHKNSRRDRSSFSDIPRKRRRLEDCDGVRGDKLYYEKNIKCNYDEGGMKNYDDEDSDDEMIFVLGGSLKEERRPKSSKKHMMPELPNDMMDPMMYNEGENEDPRPFAKRSPMRREPPYKKERIMSRGPERCNVGMKRRGRGGGGMPRKGKLRDRDDPNEMGGGFYPSMKSQRASESTYSYSNQPRKLEVCKFYLNDCCTKRDKCIYMHSDFPCKYYHTPGLTCHLGKSCKFSHSKLDEIQRAVLKKYADLPCKEIDDMQRYHRENSGNSTYTAHKEKKEAVTTNNNQTPRNRSIPSLFDVKVSVPPEFRGIEGIIVKEDEEEGGSTPMPSPQSLQMLDEEECEQASSKPKHDNVPPEQNNHHPTETTEGEESEWKLSSEEETRKSHHKKRSKKSDDHSDSERSRKHSEKRKKHSRKEEKNRDKDKKKNKAEEKQASNSCVDMFPELEEPPWDLEDNTEEKKESTPPPPTTPVIASPAITEEQLSPKHEQKELTDALSHLPKKQQELFLRIQQHQKEAETSQNDGVDEEEDVDDMKSDVNWYSSDEEEDQEKSHPVTTSALDTILRTIKTNSNNVPNDQTSANHTDNLNTYLPISTSSSITTQEADSVVVDASQLANIDLSDEVTQLLTSIMKTETSTTNHSISSYSLPITTNVEQSSIVDQSPIVTRRPSDDRTYKRDIISDISTSKEDEDYRLLHTNSILNASLFASSRDDPNPNKDIDLRTLPFKPVPIHDAATEINASITAHPPMEYKLTPLPFIRRVNYASLTDLAKACPNDPRFKRKLHPVNAEAAETTHVLPPFIPQQDPRQALPLKTMNEAPRVDPRLADPRKVERVDPRLDNKNVSNMKNDQRGVDPRFVEPKIPDKEQVRPTVDFRDPRLKGCKFPDVPPIPFPMISPMPPQMIPEMAQMPLRKEDPRLRFRANQK